MTSAQPTLPLETSVPIKPAVTELRRLRKQLAAEWSWAAVESQFYSSGGTIEMAKAFFEKHSARLAKKPWPTWRLAVPRAITKARSLRRGA